MSETTVVTLVFKPETLTADDDGQLRHRMTIAEACELVDGLTAQIEGYELSSIPAAGGENG